MWSIFLGTDGQDPIDAIRTIVTELTRFSLDLASKERWLVFNKIDLVPADELEERCQQILQAYDWQGPVFRISAAERKGTVELCQKVMTYLETHSQ